MVIVILSIILYFTYVLADLFRSFLQGVQSEQVAVKGKKGKKIESLILLRGLFFK